MKSRTVNRIGAAQINLKTVIDDMHFAGDSGRLRYWMD
jgi:hypothetical protein